MAETQPLHGIRLLLVDDDEDTRAIIERVLSRRGADVIAVPSAPMHPGSALSVLT